MAENFVGKVIVITGASSRLGEAAARRLAGDGAKLVLAAQCVDRLAALAVELGLGAEAAVETDVRDAEQVKALIDGAVTVPGTFVSALEMASLPSAQRGLSRLD